MGAWLKWFLADRWQRSINPHASFCYEDYVEQQRFVWRKKVPELQRLLELAPNNGVVTASLADAVLFAGPGEDPQFLARADWLIRRAAALAPEHPEVEQVRALYERVLQSTNGTPEE